MTVLIVERVPPGLRGELSRWLLEPRAGVFVGRLSALVRERLWREVSRRVDVVGAGLLIHVADREQGFAIEMVGDPSRLPVDMEGLTLIRRPG